MSRYLNLHSSREDIHRQGKDTSSRELLDKISLAMDYTSIYLFSMTHSPYTDILSLASAHRFERWVIQTCTQHVTFRFILMPFGLESFATFASTYRFQLSPFMCYPLSAPYTSIHIPPIPNGLYIYLLL